MKIRQISNDIAIKKYIKALDVDRGGVAILAAKHRHYLVEIEDLHVGAANILKQDALSVGADLAVPKGTIVAEQPRVNALLIGTKRELEKLVQKEKLQPFGLKNVSAYLEKILKLQEGKQPQIMGIINANDDSFYSGSRFQGNDAVATIERMIEEGADIIDVGAVSSRPGAVQVDEDEELERIRDIADLIYEQKLYEKVRLSVDSYAPKVIAYMLERGFSIVNDITGLENDRVCELIAEYNASAVIMHMQGMPQTMQNEPSYDNVVEEVYAYLQRQAEKAESYGIKKITLDIGIGFGKTLKHNIELLQHLPHFRSLGYPLLVGASRKSMIDKISQSSVERRLGGTLALHLYAARNGADILRVHDVYEHRQAFAVEQALKEFF